MKKIRWSLFIVFTVIGTSCNRQDPEGPVPVTLAPGPVLQEKNNPVPVPAQPAMNRQQVDETVISLLEESHDFHWDWTDIRTIWSATNLTYEVAVGYKPAALENIEQIISKINISSAPWKAVHDSLLQMVLSEVNKGGQRYSISDILVDDDPVLPVFILRLNNKEALTRLYNLKNVRYLEPYGYWPQQQQVQRSASGCNASTQALNTADWTTIAPGCRLPWDFNNLNIPAAWNTAQGQNIQIGVIDAGLSSTQTLLGTDFTNGYSNVPRTVTTDFTYGTSAYNSCTHGTSMCGLAAGPRNSQNATTGVAYKANLHFIRACADVVLDEAAELTGVKNALKRMADMSSINIISMSVGTPFYSGVLYDGISYAYGKGKMIFAAAGTSFSWTSWWGVIYPASFSECVAVTGTVENGNTCYDCHDGQQVDFTVPMERNASHNRNSLSLPLSGSVPTYIGGSSCATAIAAGVAGLAWSVKPTLTRAQVLTILQRTSQYYPSPGSTHGYGNLNAGAAVAMALTY